MFSPSAAFKLEICPDLAEFIHHLLLGKSVRKLKQDFVAALLLVCFWLHSLRGLHSTRCRHTVRTKRVSRPPVMQGQATRKPRKRENGENESKSLLEWSQKSMPEIDLGLEVVVLMLMIREWWLSQRLL